MDNFFNEFNDEEALREKTKKKMKTRKRSKGKSIKKVDRQIKKLKKHLKVIAKRQANQPWWGEGINKSAPKLLELLAVIYQSNRDKKPDK